MEESAPRPSPAAPSLARSLFAAPAARKIAWNRWDLAALALGALLAAWVFALKMRAFDRLAYQDDLYLFVELATSWLDGRWFQDNHYGFMLRYHTFFLVLPLGLLVKPFGAAGLFFATAVAAGASGLLATRILRALEVPAPWALAAGFFVVTTPFSLVTYHDPYHGFHLELLVLPFALGLFHALLRGTSALACVVWALLVISIKEEMALVAIVLGLVALLEKRAQGERWSRTALLVIGLALVSLPINIAIMRAASAGDPHDAFSRIRALGEAHEDVHTATGLVVFVARNVLPWLGSPVVGLWLLLVLLTSSGLVLLRPHYVPLALPLTITTWLMRSEIQWSPRFVLSLCFAWAVALLGIASLFATGRRLWATGEPRDRRRVRALALVTVFAALATSAGAVVVEPWARDPLTLDPWSPYTTAERADADALFARYRAEGRADEPVVASPWLFFYAQDRFPRWHHVRREPPAVWVLWDDGWQDMKEFGLVLEDHDVVGRRGRFSLLKRKPGR